MSTRLSDFADLAAQGMLERRSTADGLRIRLRDSPAIERRTRELIAAEARCCPFLDFDLRREGGALVLVVTGLPDAREVIDALFELA